MTLKQTAWLECDLCGCGGPAEEDGMGAVNAARIVGWRTVYLNGYGLVRHICPRWVDGRGNKELAAAILVWVENR
jgi:hypothetical protein